MRTVLLYARADDGCISLGRGAGGTSAQGNKSVHLPNANGVTLSRVVEFMETSWAAGCSLAAEATRATAGVRIKQRVSAEAAAEARAAEATAQRLAAAATEAQRLADEARTLSLAAQREAVRWAAEETIAAEAAEAAAVQAATTAEAVAVHENRGSRTLGSSSRAPFMPCEREFVAQLECATLLEILVVRAPRSGPQQALCPKDHTS